MSELSEEAKELIKATEWPGCAEDATADALIAHGARLALAWEAEKRPLSRRVFKMAKDDPERPEAMRRYLDATTAMIAEAQVTAALVAIQEASREQANGVARRLWHYTEDGGLLSELMFDYLDARGISSEAVWEAAQEDVASRARSTAQDHDPRCISLTDSEFNDVCDCKTLRMIDGQKPTEP